MIVRSTRVVATLFCGGMIVTACGPRQPEPGAGATASTPAAVATPAAPSASADSVLVGDWVLVSIPGRTFNVPPGSKPATLSFAEAEKRASGDASCNRYSGPYTKNGDSLTFGALVSTKRACADQALNDRESAFLSALSNTQRYRIDGRRLQLLGAGGLVAELERAGG